MFAHFDPDIQPQRLSAFFAIDDFPLDLKPSLRPGYHGPFVRRHEFAEVRDDAVAARELLVGSFGLIPHWSKDDLVARRTYNARSETVHEKPSFRDARRQSRHSIIPAEAIYEPDWRSGKSVATRIARADGRPMGIADLWSEWRNPQGERIHSFTMLTINAYDHPVLRQFHTPDDEKRMVVILAESAYDNWLQAPVAASRDFLRALVAEQPQQGLF